MKWILGAVALGLLATPLQARAQDGDMGTTTDRDTDTVVIVPSDESRATEADQGDKGLGVALNGGIGGYLGDLNDATTNVGPAYGVSATTNSDGPLSLELGYMGHTNKIVGTDRNLSSNKVQANVRAGPELRAPVAWRPYLFGGVAADFLAAGENDLGIENAVQGVLPFGVGADFFTDSALQVGARATYDWTPGVGEDVAPFDPNPNGWQAFLSAQAAF